ncbi:MBL fold metallo-hydrolase [Mesobacillus zeae]|uniref:MBL fold metallo-hydrolase n=1 Tax=Mesobacillus zeae TaxID=1917180 RepID=A0A398B2U1_9BACI|nr:MBL fold metallo-hydrolase [Mesobacillus zeae]RID83961.1 MBL fold metallo-hydrolase [Mesobacillus zeae]
MTEWKDGIAKLTLPTPFSVGDVHAYLLKGDRLTLVDAGVKTKKAWEAFRMQLAELQLRPEDIEQVILTHHHPDHVGLLDFLPPELEIHAHPLNQRWLDRTPEFTAMHDEFFSGLFHQFGVPEEYFASAVGQMKKTLLFSCGPRRLSGELFENDVPPALEGWKVIETPGHAQGHIALFREQDGVLVGGDMLLAKISPNPLLEPPLPGEKERPMPQLQYNESLHKLAKYPISLVHAGHGPDFGQVGALIEKRLARQHDRAMTVKKLLKQGELTVFELCRRLFPSVYEKEMSLTLSETVAQLDYLLDLDEIGVKEEDPAFLYSAAGR